MAVLAPPVQVVASGAPPFVQTPSGAPPFVVSTGPAPPITIVASGAPPITLFNADGSIWSAHTAAGGEVLLVGETDGFATDFLHPVDAERVALKSSGSTLAYAVDAFYQQSGTSPKMVYDVAGVLGWSPHNTCLQSQTFDDVSWAKSQSTVSANVIAAPNGLNEADAVIPNGGVSDVHVSRSITTTATGVANTFSVYAKNGSLGSNWIQVLVLTNSSVWFNLATGAKGSTNGPAPISYTITDVGNGWYRLILAFTAAGASETIYLAARNGDGIQSSIPANGTSPALYLWGAQMNRGIVPTAYLPTTTPARVGLALDYDPVTHAAKGLLCEPQATNLIIQSAAPATQGVTVTATAYTLSFFGTGTLTLTGASTAGPLVGTGASNRVSLTFTPTAGTLTLTKSGTVTNAQLETGTVATSYIPTLAATVTRATDLYYCTSASINYSATVGSWWAEHYTQLGQVNQVVIGTNTNAATPIFSNGDHYYGMESNASPIYSIIGSGATGNINRIACAFQAGDRAISAKGLAPTTDTGSTAGLLAPVQIYFGGGAGGGGVNMNGWLRKVRYLPRRPTNAELVSMTT